MVCCFYAWQEYATDKRATDKRLQAAARKVLGKWMHGGVSRAFERWTQFAETEKKLRAKSKTVVYRIMNMHVARSFSMWIEFVHVSKRSASELLIKQAFVLRQSLWLKRVRILTLGIHFHFLRRYFKTRRSLIFRMRYKGFVALRGHFSAWFFFVNAVKFQRDDEFTISVLKSVSNFPLQHYLEEHATRRIHSSRSSFCKSFEKQLDSLQSKACTFIELFHFGVKLSKH